MNTPLHRRDFLKAAGFASLTSVASSLELSGGERETPVATGARLLPGCCAYSFSSYLGKGKMTMEEFILKAVELGVLGVDITTYWLKSTEPGYLAGLRHLAYKQG